MALNPSSYLEVFSISFCSRTECAISVRLIIFLLIAAAYMFVMTTDAAVMWHGAWTRPLKALIDVTKLITKDAVFCTPYILHTLIHKLWDYPAPYRWVQTQILLPSNGSEGCIVVVLLWTSVKQERKSFSSLLIWESIFASVMCPLASPDSLWFENIQCLLH